MEEKAIATVKSPARDEHIRKGKGYSLEEIKEAGLTVSLLKELKIKIDYFRKSLHKSNVNTLKSFEKLKRPQKKREPFIKKEKKQTPYKPKEVIVKRKIKEETVLISESKVKKPKAKKKIAKKEPKIEKEIEEFPKKKIEVEKKEKVPEKAELISLTELTGLGATTVTKFNELGVFSVQDLLEENPEELATLIKGVSKARIKKWMEEGRNLINN